MAGEASLDPRTARAVDFGLNLGRATKWIIAAVFLILVTSAFIANPSPNPHFLILTVSLSCGVIAVPLALAFSHRAILNWCTSLPFFISCEGDSATAIVRKSLSYFRGTIPMYVAAMLFGLIGTAAIYIAEIRPVFAVNQTATIVAAVIVFTSEFFAGIGLYALVATARVIWRLGDLPACRVRIDRHNFGILGTGAVVFKCWSAAAGAWCFYIIPFIAFVDAVGTERVFLSPTFLILTVPT